MNNQTDKSFEDQIRVRQTKDYSMFKRAIGNRPYNENHIKDLIKQIKEDDSFLPYNPITVNEFMEIVVGQHRFEAAKRSNKPIFFQIKPGITVAHAKKLDANTKTWKVTEFMESYIEEGIEDYRILKEFLKTYPLPISLSIKFLSGGRTRPNQDNITMFREGKFKVTSLKEGTEDAQKLCDFIPFMATNLWKRDAFITGLFIFYKKYPNFSHQDMVKKVKKWCNFKQTQITDQGTTLRYVQLLEYIWDFRREKKNRINSF